MARTAAEIRAEYEALENKRSKDGYRLREELKALEAAPEAETPDTESVSTSMSAHIDLGPEDPYETDEWRFIEKCLAELDINVSGGVLTSAAKKQYQNLQIKVRIWRMLREVVVEQGIGNEWLDYSKTGRDHNTGMKLPEKPTEPEPIPTLGEIPSETAAQMPVDPGMPAIPGYDNTLSYEQQVKAAMQDAIGAQPVEATP